MKGAEEVGGDVVSGGEGKFWSRKAELDRPARKGEASGVFQRPLVEGRQKTKIQSVSRRGERQGSD